MARLGFDPIMERDGRRRLGSLLKMEGRLGLALLCSWWEDVRFLHLLTLQGCGLGPLLDWEDRRRLGALLELESRRAFGSLLERDGMRRTGTLLEVERRLMFDPLM